MDKNLEKSLKRFLKRIVKITMGLVVSFLITGTVSIAKEIKADKKEKFKNINAEEYIINEEILKNILREISVGNIHITEKDEIFDKSQEIGNGKIGINNGKIEFVGGKGQFISGGIGINNNTISNSGNWGQGILGGLGINNGIIANNEGPNNLNTGWHGQYILEAGVGINNGAISNSEHNGQDIAIGLGINNGTISNGGNYGQNIAMGLGINNGVISNGGDYGQNISMGLGINNGIISNGGDCGQKTSYGGLGINNGIIINNTAYKNEEGTLYKNGIALKKDDKENLILNNDDGNNDNINILGKKELTSNKLSEVITNNNITQKDVGEKIKGYNLFINNLGNETDGSDRDNQLIIDTNLSDKFANTHITTAVTEKGYTKDEGVIKVSKTDKTFSMDKSTIVGYFEKGGTLVDMTEVENITLNDSVISANVKEIDKNNHIFLKPTAINFGAGSSVTLNNSTVNGKMDFSKGGDNTLTLKGKYNGNDNNTYKDGTQFMTSVNDVSFGAGDDTINVEIQKGTADDKNKTGKGFINLGKVDFGAGNDTLKFSFEDYKSGHFSISGEKEIEKQADGKVTITKHHGIDFGDGDDKIVFSDVLDMEKYTELDGTTTTDTAIEKNIVMLNNLLSNESMPLKNLETLQLADGGNVFYFETKDKDGKTVKLNFNGTVVGGTGDDTFTISAVGLQNISVDGGESQKDIFNIGKINSVKTENEYKDYSVLSGKINNFENINVNQNIKFASDLDLSGTKNIVIGKENNLFLGINYGENSVITDHALYNKGITVDNQSGKLIIETSSANKDYIISMGENKSNILNKNENLLISDSSVHHLEIIDEEIHIKVNEHILGDNSMGGAVKYAHLDKIYQSIVSAGKISEMSKSTTLTDKGEGEEAVNKSIQAQLEFYGKIYHSTPYAYSNDVSKKSADLITESIMNLDIMPEYKHWIFGGSIAGQESNSDSNFYGSNYYTGIDIGKNEVSADTNIYGAYAFGKYGISENQSIGFAVAGTRSDTDISGNSKLEGDAVYVSAFAEQEKNNLKLLAGISYQHSFYDSTRNVSNDYQSMSVDKKYEDDLISIFAGGKYSYHLGNNFFAEPNIKLSVTHVMQDSIDEGDNGKLTIETDKKDFTFVEGEIGLDLVKKVNLSKGILNIKAGTSLVYSLDGYEEEYLTGRITGAEKDFEMISPEDDRSKIKFTVGTEYEMTNGMFMNLHGNYTTSSHTEDYAVSFGAGYKF